MHHSYFFNKHRALFYKNSFDRKHISLTILISNVYFLSKNISHKNFKILVQRVSYTTSNLSSLALPINKDDKTNKHIILFFFCCFISSCFSMTSSTYFSHMKQISHRLGTKKICIKLLRHKKLTVIFIIAKKGHTYL